MAKLLQLRRGTTTEHSTFTGAVGELTVDTTKDTAVVHDGSTVGGFPLAKFSDIPTDYLPTTGGTLTGSLTTQGDVEAESFSIPTGTSSQFLKADGSVDSNTYGNLSTSNSWSQQQTFLAGIKLYDYDSLYLGTGGDIRLYHSGSSSYFYNYTGSWYIANHASAGLYLDASYGVYLRHNGANKIQTVSNGVSITGSIREDVYSMSSNTVIDPANGSMQYTSLISDTTYTSNLSSGHTVTLMIANGGTYNVTWPTIYWVGGVAPTLTSTSSMVYDIILLWNANYRLYGRYIGTAGE